MFFPVNKSKLLGWCYDYFVALINEFKPAISSYSENHLGIANKMFQTSKLSKEIYLSVLLKNKIIQ